MCCCSDSFWQKSVHGRARECTRCHSFVRLSPVCWIGLYFNWERIGVENSSTRSAVGLPLAVLAKLTVVQSRPKIQNRECRVEKAQATGLHESFGIPRTRPAAKRTESRLSGSNCHRV